MMTHIVSLDNKTVKHLVKLASDRKYRFLCGEYAVEGLRWVEDAIAFDKSQASLSLLVLSDSAKERHWTALSAYVDSEKVVFVSEAVFQKLAQTENSPGVLAVLRIPPPPPPPQANDCLFLDRVRDPGNLGTILRTACAAGFTDVVLNGCADVYNPKTVRSCMTGILHLRIHENVSVQQMKADGYRLVAADLNGTDLYAYKSSTHKICLVIGNEADGISPQIRAQCDDAVTIPMQNIESLNAAVSAGILMYWLKKNEKEI